MAEWLRHTGSALKNAFKPKSRGLADAQDEQARLKAGASDSRRAPDGVAARARRTLAGRTVVGSVCRTPGGVKVAAVGLGRKAKGPVYDQLKIETGRAFNGPPSVKEAAEAREHVAEWLETAARTMRGRLAGVVLVIPRRHVSLRYVTLPSDDAVQIDQMVGYQLHQLVPFEKEKAVYGATPVVRHADGSSTVMVSVIRRDVLDSYLAAVEGLPVIAVLVDAEALALAADTPAPAGELPTAPSDSLGDDPASVESSTETSRQGGPGGVLVVEKDDHQALIYVPGGATPVLFSRALPLEDAEDASLAEEIAASIRSFQRRVPRASVKEVILKEWKTSSRALASKLRAAIPQVEVREAEHTGTDFLEGNAGKGEGSSSEYGEAASSAGSLFAGGPEAMSFRSVLGPLLRVGEWKTDLCPVEMRQRTKSRGLRRQLIRTGSLIVLLTLLSAALFAARVARIERRLGGIESALVALEPSAERVQSMDQVLRDLDAVRGGTDMLDAMAELSSVIPASMKVSAMTYQRGRLLDVTGTAGGLEEVLEAARRLEDSPLFAQATVRYANARRGREANVTDYRMVLTMTEDMGEGR